MSVRCILMPMKIIENCMWRHVPLLCATKLSASYIEVASHASRSGGAGIAPIAETLMSGWNLNSKYNSKINFVTPQQVIRNLVLLCRRKVVKIQYFALICVISTGCEWPISVFQNKNFLSRALRRPLIFYCQILLGTHFLTLAYCEGRWPVFSLSLIFSKI